MSLTFHRRETFDCACHTHRLVHNCTWYHLSEHRPSPLLLVLPSLLSHTLGIMPARVLTSCGHSQSLTEWHRECSPASCSLKPPRPLRTSKQRWGEYAWGSAWWPEVVKVVWTEDLEVLGSIPTLSFSFRVYSDLPQQLSRKSYLCVLWRGGPALSRLCLL